MGTRQTTPHDPFTYLDNALAHDLAADIAVAFFAVYLLNDPGSATFLARLDVPAHVVRRL